MNDLVIKPSNLVQFQDNDNKLGEGSFGVVYKGLYCDTPVAVKNLKIRKDDENERKAFMDEMKLLSQLRHPNISSILGIGEKKIILELYEGNATKIPTFEEMAIVARDCMRALSYMHRHADCVKHGDIKPENILVNRFGTGGIKKASIGDVGLSRACVMTNPYTGTAGFMPPIEPTDRMHDVFALAVSLLDSYFPVEVHTTFPGVFSDDNTFEYASKTPPAVKNVISIMLATVDHPDITDELKNNLLSHITGEWQRIVDNGVYIPVIKIPTYKSEPGLEEVLLKEDSLENLLFS